MAKQHSEEMTRLQKRLIPVNIAVSIVSFIAAISLFFCPLLKVDMGKLSDSPVIKGYALNAVKSMTKRDADFKDINSSIDMSMILEPVVDKVMDKLEGEFSITTSYLMELALSSEPANVVINTLFYDDNGMINQLSVSIADGINEALESPEMRTTLDEVVVDSVSSAIVKNLPQEYADRVDTNQLNQAVKKLDTVKSEDDAVAVVNDYITELENSHGLQTMTDKQKDNIESQVRDMYQDTIEHTADENGDNFTLEAFLCITASKMLSDAGLDGGIDLGELLNNLGNGGGEVVEETFACRTMLTAEAEDGATTDDGEQAPDNSDGKDEEKPATIYTSYDELLDNVIKIPEDFGEQLADKVTGGLVSQAGEVAEEVNKYAVVFMIVFVLFAVYAGVWALLGIWSLLRIFMRNKRFSMWYVKLLGASPCIIFGGLLLAAKYALPLFSLEEAVLSVVNAVLPALSTLTWISGICYLVLWAISIFWAHPIKNKIRRA